MHILAQKFWVTKAGTLNSMSAKQSVKCGDGRSEMHILV